MVHHLARDAAIVAAALLTTVGGFAGQPASPNDCAARASLPEQIRAFDCRLITRVSDGLARSPTLRGIVTHIGELKGIVYIDEGYYRQPRTGRLFAGALSHEVRKAGERTILRIRVALQPGDLTVTTLGHELQHVVEVLESPAARTEDAVDDLFGRIGARIYNDIVETLRAREIELQVGREVKQSRRTLP